MESFTIASSISVLLLVGWFMSWLDSIKIWVYLIQLIFLPMLGGEDLIGVYDFSKSTRLWSEDSWNMFVILVCYRIRCSAMSKMSNLNIKEEGKNVRVSGAEIW